MALMSEPDFSALSPHINHNEHLLFMIDFNCSKTQQFLQMVLKVLKISSQIKLHTFSQAEANKLFANPYKWIMDYGTIKDNLNEFLNYSILVDSDFNLLLYVDRNVEISVVKLFKTHRKSQNVKIENYAQWTPEYGLVYDTSSRLRRRKTLNVTLNACLVITNNDSLNHLTDKRYVLKSTHFDRGKYL